MGMLETDLFPALPPLEIPDTIMQFTFRRRTECERPSVARRMYRGQLLREPECVD